MTPVTHNTITKLTVPEMCTFLSSCGYDITIESRKYTKVFKRPIIKEAHSVVVIRKNDKEIKNKIEVDPSCKLEVLIKTVEKELKLIALKQIKNHLS